MKVEFKKMKLPADQTYFNKNCSTTTYHNLDLFSRKKF